MPDFVFLLESRLNPEQLRIIEVIGKAAQDYGAHLYLVGGALRDLVYGYPVRDLDFAVEGQALKVIQALTKRPLDGRPVSILEIDEGLRDAHLVFPGNITVEIAACRAERRERPGARPKVEFAGIYEDLRRRDFSMNAIGLSLNPNSRGLLIDPNNGVADIERHEIRILHSYSFVDDPVRLIRAVRFRMRLRFALEERTAAHFKAGIEGGLIEGADPARLRREFRELAREENAVDVVRTLDKDGLMTAFHPRLTGSRLNIPMLGELVKTSRNMEDAGVYSRLDAPFVYSLLGKLSGRERSDLIRRLGLKRADTEPFQHIEAAAQKLAKVLGSKQANTPSRVFQILSAQPGELLLFLLLYFRQKKIQSKVRNYLFKHRRLRENLPSADLATLGVAPGDPRHGKILDAYFFGLLDGKVRTSKDPLKPLRKLLAEVK
jgi:tRNA nucleotidyltransferase/poly(A) polymerase